jgi:hypothetical protein
MEVGEDGDQGGQAKRLIDPVFWEKFCPAGPVGFLQGWNPRL